MVPGLSLASVRNRTDATTVTDTEYHCHAAAADVRRRRRPPQEGSPKRVLVTVTVVTVRLFIVSVTGSRIFVGCRLLSSRRVDDWVSTYHSWEQPRCPYAISNLKAPAHIYRPDPDPPRPPDQL